MRTSYRILSALLIALLFVTGTAFAAIPEDYNVKTPENLVPGHLYGTSCIVMDADTGRVILEKNANERRYPASTTKIMTCIIALENGPMGELITIPNGVEPASGSSKLGITPGEIMPFEDLVYGMMIASGNDASLAIAILTSGTENAFVQLMNQKVKDLGLTGTHFVNSHGLHTVNHYTTAHDLAIITRYAMANETFRDIVQTVSYDMQPTNIHPNGRTITTKYDLLIEGKALYYEPCIGVKTGYTNAAGRCFVGAGEMGGHTLISVTLGTNPEDDLYIQAFTDTIRLLKYGFLQYESLSFNDMYALCEDTL
ncbi:MAG: D-alanyl-D-alanine carboxypeptidase, partial [Clostridia bacterium]|nr:D-alanyl-D-alanine carboxypeptidase [Clostridia bacterium]